MLLLLLWFLLSQPSQGATGLHPVTSVRLGGSQGEWFVLGLSSAAAVVPQGLPPKWFGQERSWGGDVESGCAVTP